MEWTASFPNKEMAVIWESGKDYRTFPNMLGSTQIRFIPLPKAKQHTGWESVAWLSAVPLKKVINKHILISVLVSAHCSHIWIQRTTQQIFITNSWHENFLGEASVYCQLMAHLTPLWKPDQTVRLAGLQIAKLFFPKSPTFMISFQ